MRIPVVLLCLIVSVVVCSSLSRAFAAHATDVWLRDGSINAIEKHEYLSSEDFENFWRSYMGVHARQSCEDKTVELAPDVNQNSCWYESSIGEHTAYGNFIKPQGEGYAGLVGVDGQTRIIPLFNDQGFIELQPHIDGGFMMGLRAPGNTELEVVADYDGVKAYGFANEADLVLRDQGGNPWLVDDNLLTIDVWFSENGRFMLMADETEGELVRIDLETFEIANVTYALESDGSDTFGTFSITNDGQQVAVNVFGHAPRLLHLADCALSEHNYIAEAVSCPTRDLGQAIAALAPGSSGLGDLALFTSNNTIDFYSDTALGNVEHEAFTLYAPGTYQPGTDYLALGDSYASGEGARQYYSGTNRSENECHLSKVSYPFLLGDRLDFDSTHSIACSGSKIQNVTGSEEDIDSTLEDDGRTNQYHPDFEGKELGDFTPGRGPQLRYVKDVEPDIVTVSIFGNDAGFASYLKECTAVLAPWDTCFDSDAERWSLVNKINQQFDRLVDTYSQIRKNLAPGGRAYAIGYPEFVVSGGDCGNNVRLNAAEVDLTLGLSRYLNFVIQRATVKAGITYVDVSDALKGHKHCEPGRKAVRGVTFSAINHNPMSPTFRESFHPDAFGHILMERAILDMTDDLTKQNPRPDRHIDNAPSVEDAVAFDVIGDPGVADAHQTLLEYLEPDELKGENVVIRGSSFPGKLNGDAHGLEQNSEFSFELHSDPIQLGTVMSDSSGSLNFNLQIPSDVEPGFHRLRVYGHNTAGEPIELRYLLYIAASEEDWDGDGVPNSQQACLVQLPAEESGEMSSDWCENALSFNQSEPVASPATPHPVHLADFPAGESTTITVVATPSSESQSPGSTEDTSEGDTSSQAENRSTVPDKRTLFVAAVLVIMIAVLLFYRYTQKAKA